MAEDFLEEIYKKSILIDEIEVLIENLHDESIRPANYRKIMGRLLPEITEICKEYVSKGNIIGEQVWNVMTKLSTLNSYVRVADSFELHILPMVKEYVKEFAGIDITDEDGVQIVSSETSFLTLYDTKTDTLYHSKSNPMKEARIKAKTLFRDGINEYVFYGCGLGYLPYQMYKISDGSIHISVYFADEKSYEYSKLYGVLEWIPDENIDIFIENDVKGFLDCVSSNKSEYYIFKPELRFLSSEISALMNDLISRQITLFDIKKCEKININSNLTTVGRFVSEYDKSKIKNIIMVIAGGPSVDYNIDFIKNNHDKMSIICVGTIFRRLLTEGIIPDIVSVIDPFDTTLVQMEDIDNFDATLVAGLNAYWKTVRAYRGDTYLAAIDDDLETQSKCAKLDGESIFPSSTTVTIFAYNLARYFGAEEIYLIGADFAYPNQMSHASGVSYCEKLNTDGMIQVSGVDGKKVYTTEVMNSYREELEEYIKETSDITVYNMSKNGAKIRGTVCYK